MALGNYTFSLTNVKINIHQRLAFFELSVIHEMIVKNVAISNTEYMGNTPYRDVLRISFIINHIDVKPPST